MHHVAIMKKSWGLIPKILSGEKTIESRWYRTRRVPWGKIHEGDTVFFKNAGEPVTARARVSCVMQFELDTKEDAQRIADRYGARICLLHRDVNEWESIPRYCILVELSHAASVAEPFQIDKSGFGTGAAWITVRDVASIKLPAR